MRHLVLLLLVLFSLTALAEMDVDGIEELLPRHETRAERLKWEGREDEMPDRDRMSDPPPQAPVRNVAEWEPATGVIVRYPLGLPYSLLRDFDDDVTLHVVVSNGSYNSAVSNLTNNGVDMDRVEFLIRSNDSIWTRDYGPWYVFDGNGDVNIIDHTYNRPWRPNDNMIPVYFGQQQGIPVISHDMFHTGGNYMTDGHHISMSTELVYNEASSNNGMNSSQVDQLMFNYYGVEDYEVLDYIESGGIHHIDTWAKFLDEETVLVKEVWPSHHTYTKLNQRAALIASLQASTGRNYQVHRVYCHDIGWSDPASYTNSLILNDCVYVPTFGNSSYDNQALQAYEDAMPGYTVSGYYYSGFITDDALHCRAKGAYDAGMLRVEHVPLREEMTGPVEITALVDDRSESGVSVVELHYRFAGEFWQTINMSAQGGDLYAAEIPSPVSDTSVDYYIHAEDNSGRVEGMPRVEPAHWYNFSILAGDMTSAGPASAPARLNAAYPNPFNPKTTFSFELEYADPVLLQVFDSSGRLIRSLIDGPCQPGTTEVDWDGRDDAGRRLASGVYHYRLRAAGIQYSRPVVLAK
ncbi:MAG: agmatine deiminase family protein [Candidatus Krumholzibacteria bacterium]|nr:agmatine deiminase family protein [Candidatus Krumholzibacteria bacterium]MDP6668817.1 agmatine deiminase family protein [Candidatus Krumholzibacteria bacterium]MDP6796943.1 agmatine deiminase family protein [Candidatus Krumholzibacteria bacterium]MDP7022338.1 agmatine deiminase family protein [Candidatus Krumholzibacteria bacterium]